MSAPTGGPDEPTWALGVRGGPDGPGSPDVAPQAVWGAGIEWLVMCTTGSVEGTPSQALFLTFVSWYTRRCLGLGIAPVPCREETFSALLDELDVPVTRTDGLGRGVRDLAVLR